MDTPENRLPDPSQFDNFGRYARAVRAAKNWSYKDICRRWPTGECDVSNVGNVERIDRNAPGDKQILRWAQAVGFEQDQIRSVLELGKRLRALPPIGNTSPKDIFHNKAAALIRTALTRSIEEEGIDSVVARTGVSKNVLSQFMEGVTSPVVTGKLMFELGGPEVQELMLEEGRRVQACER